MKLSYLPLYYSDVKSINPLDNSYTNPIVNNIKKVNTIQYPYIETECNDIRNGNKNNISKSNTKNNIPTKIKCTENLSLAEPKGFIPHSYGDNFSTYESNLGK